MTDVIGAVARDPFCGQHMSALQNTPGAMSPVLLTSFVGKAFATRRELREGLESLGLRASGLHG